MCNQLPVPVFMKVHTTIFDPFHKELTEAEVYDWIMNHLIFDNKGQMIALFNNDTILWEKS